jgi:murein DD-endopeptidase MepM/ murein hydrolase activator NlpD/muramidase (phage lysozyme)
MAISSPLKLKVTPVATTPAKTVKKFQGILFNRTRVRKEIFQRKTILQNRRVENERRKQLEDELEAPNLVIKPRGPSQLIAGSAKGFFDRLIGFLGYLTAGWIINNLPTWIAMGKEFIARTQQMGKILGNFILNSTDIFKNFTRLLGATLTNLMEFDFLDTSGRVSTAFDELNLSVENWGTGFEDVIKLITTPLTEGIASGEDAPSTGTENTNEGAYERTAPYSGTPAPQVMLQGGISGTTALLPAGAKGADRNIGATDRFGYSSSRGRQHNGIDIGTSKQKGYYVAFLLDGTATLGNQPEGAGLFVEIKSGGTTYKFFHLAKFSIKSGPYKAGTAIGEIGSTGSSTSEHLHYEVWPPGTRGVNPEPYLNLIRIGKNLGKPIAASVSVASLSNSQPQQNLMGTPSSSSSGGGRYGTKEERSLLDAISFAEGTKSSYGTMFGGGISKDLESGKLTVKQVIDLGDAHAKKNGRSGAAGRYQFMPFTLEDLVRTGDLKMDDKFTSQMQDKAALALARRRKVTSELLKKEGLSAKVSNMLSPEWASLPTYSGASYYGQPVKSLSSIQSVYKKSLGAPQQAQVASQSSSPAPAQTSSPSPAQITPTGTPQNPQIPQSLAQERIGPTVIVSQNPSSPARQMMYSGGGGSSGGGSSPISDFALLNNFIKNKLLLDLAYL